MKSWFKRVFVIGAIPLLLLVLIVLRFSDLGKEPAPAGDPARREIKVGFLPVTCHLTCPVTDFASKTSKTTHFVSQRFVDFPTVVDAIKSGRLQASFMIAPLAMKLRSQGVPVKIVYLGHRDGSTVMVHKDLPAQNLKDLKGKKFAIPSRASNQYLVIRKLMKDQGMNAGDLEFLEMAPPDMPVALATKSIDAYFVGEPHAAKAELNGSGRVLYHAKDIWPGFVSCVLVVHEDLIREDRAVVADLVRGIAESGEWAEQNRLKAAKLAAPYFRQDQKVLEYVLTQPPDRVSYKTLTPTDSEMQLILDLAVEEKILQKPILLADVLDRSFIPQVIKAAQLEVAEQ